MSRLQQAGWVLVTALLLISCGSKQTVTRKSEAEKKKEKEIYLKRESDAVFTEFKRRNEGKVNSFTVDYIGTYKDIAIQKMVEYKIPASITLAQGILESGNGLSELTRKANNHFGIKCHKSWTGKKVYHDDDRRNECFRKYPSAEGSFNDHSLFLTSRGRYEFLFDLDPDDYKGWAKGLKKAGYATDRKYPKKLISFIENFELYRYDDLVLDDKGYKKKRKRSDELIASNGQTYTVSKGDTLYSIAKRHNLSVDELKAMNNLRSNHLDIGQKLLVSE